MAEAFAVDAVADAGGEFLARRYRTQG